MKKSLLFRLLSAAVVMFSLVSVTSCTEDNLDTGMPTLNLSTSELLFDNSGAPADDNGGVLKIEANRDWVITVDESASEWLSVEPLSGSGNADVYVTIPATETGRSGNFSVEVYNAYGVLIQERVSVSQGEVTQGDVTFDGSELPTSYGTDEVISVDGMDFTITSVANFTELYPDSSGAIQFAKTVSYLYNNTAFENLAEVTITLAPAGTSYNNFIVYAGTEKNPTDGEILTPTKDGDVCYYTIPEGCQYIRIANPSDYTAYASEIALKSTAGSTDDPETPEDPETPDDPSDGQSISMDGSELPTAYGEAETIDVDGVAFIASYVANFSSLYETSGPIQFKGSVNAYLANTGAITDLKEVQITLAPAGTSYNNFELYVGTAYGSTTTAVEGVRVDDIVTYTIPEGCEFVSIQNNSTYTAYAFQIDFNTTTSGTTEPDPDPEPDPETPDEPSTGESISMDGSELPTAYGESETIDVDGVSFTASYVANFSSMYETSGPIQFKGSSSAYLANNGAITGLAEIQITLAPAGTSYNNFELYVGTALGETTTAVEGVRVDDVVTYIIPEGSEFVSIQNNSTYTAYAFQIDFNTTTSGTVDPDPEPDPDPETPDEPSSGESISMDGSELPTAYAESTEIDIDGVSFTASYVANFTATYESSGPIQFKGSSSAYLSNNGALTGLTEIILNLAPAGTSYNNFQLFVGTTLGDTTTEVVGVRVDDDVTYTIPAGYEFVSIQNNSTYTAYAFTIDFICE